MAVTSRMRRMLGAILALLMAVTLVPLAGPAGAVGTFDDDDGNIHEENIEKIAALGITKGCNPPDNNLYCPDDFVTRQQMASFLVRTFDLPPGPSGQFTDTSGSVHAADIDALAQSGITKGCNPPDNTEYCPTDLVTRGQMAAFMARGLDLAEITEDFFGDDDGSIFELQINAIARVGITKGCNPPENTEYCPDNPVRRDEMASFLSRVADIVTTGTTSTTTPAGASTTTTSSSSTTTTSLPPAGPCNANQLITLPCRFDWDIDEGGSVDDGDGVGTGFTKVLETTNGTGYVADNIDVVTSGSGVLELTTTAGILNTNAQDNALGVQIAPPDALITAHTSLLTPPAGTGQSQQAGLWLGPEEDNYVKVVLLSDSTGGTKVEVATENQGVLTSNAKIPVPSDTTVELRMIINAETQTVTGEYRLGSSGAWSPIATAEPPSQVFGFDPAGNATYVGLFASHRNGPGPLAYDFDFFDVTGQDYPPPPPGPIGFGPRAIFSLPDAPPTSMVWAPDGKLYVATVTGAIYRLTYDPSKDVSQRFALDGLPITTLQDNHHDFRTLLLGLAVDPAWEANPTGTPVLWAVHSEGFGVTTDPGVLNSGVVSRLSGDNFETEQVKVQGLPRSQADHAPNSVHFGPDGRLYMVIGGNTGAGAPSENPADLFGKRPEQPLGAAIVRFEAAIRESSWNLGNQGDCATAVNQSNGTATTGIRSDCHAIVYASGLRNSYDFVFHPNEKTYATDNGLGNNTSAAPDIDAPTTDCQGFSAAPTPGEQPDKIHLIEQNDYYGHPNPARGECVFFDGSEQGVTPPANYQPAIHVISELHRSANGIIAYDGSVSGACDALDGDLLTTYFGNGDYVARYRPSVDGSTLGDEITFEDNLENPLTLVQGPQGVVFVGEFGPQDGTGAGAKVTALTPTTGC